MNQNLDELFREALGQQSEPGEFWGAYIDFIEKKMIDYFIQLKSQGLDKALLTAVSRSDLEETTKERLEQIKQAMMALSKLNKVFNEKTQQASELYDQLNIHQGKTETLERELNARHSEFQDYKQTMDKKLQVQKNQIQKKLNDNTVMVRQSVTNINEYMQQASTQSGLEFKQLHSKVQDAVEIIVDTLSEQHLWPTNEAKPNLIEIGEKPLVIKKVNELEKEQVIEQEQEKEKEKEKEKEHVVEQEVEQEKEQKKEKGRKQGREKGTEQGKEQEQEEKHTVGEEQQLDLFASDQENTSNEE